MLRMAAVNAIGRRPNFDDLPYGGYVCPARVWGRNYSRFFARESRCICPPPPPPFDSPSQTSVLSASGIDRTHRL